MVFAALAAAEVDRPAAAQLQTVGASASQTLLLHLHHPQHARLSEHPRRTRNHVHHQAVPCREDAHLLELNTPVGYAFQPLGQQGSVGLAVEQGRKLINTHSLEFEHSGLPSEVGLGGHFVLQ